MIFDELGTYATDKRGRGFDDVGYCERVCVDDEDDSDKNEHENPWETQSKSSNG
jgi:hypothetical protein